MADPLKQNPRVLPAHGTPDGDRVAATITVKVYASGALSVEGAIGDKRWACAALDNAKDAIKGQGAGLLIVPPKDVSI